MTDRLPAHERANLVALMRKLSPRTVSIQRPAIPADLAGLVGRDPPRVPRAVLFDVYGTLIASAAGGEPLAMTKPLTPEGERARGLLASELQEAGFSGNAEDFSAAVAGAIKRANAEGRKTLPFPEVDIQHILASLLAGTEITRLRRLAILLECWRNPCSPMPGARELIGSFAVAGVPLGLVSNAQFYTPLLLEALYGRTPGISAGLSLFSWRLGIAKPDQAFFARAAELLADIGIQSRDALVVGNDAANDVAPAAARGFMTALLARDARSFRPPAGSESAGSEAMPDIVATDLADIARVAGVGRRGSAPGTRGGQRPGTPGGGFRPNFFAYSSIVRIGGRSTVEISLRTSL